MLKIMKHSYNYKSMYTKYNYKHHTLIQVCILNVITHIGVQFLY